MHAQIHHTTHIAHSLEVLYDSLKGGPLPGIRGPALHHEVVHLMGALGRPLQPLPLKHIPHNLV